ncbi:glycosyltransferase [Streptomyces sp. NBC_01390]|uniref:glycosyltransferase n=1 Tax=Streptomyces sp. NBC_01390 TaxID=2903850 RepID=UPI003863EDA8
MTNSRRATRIVLLTIGSRGDVQPFVMLGVELKARGHEVVPAAGVEFRGLADRAGSGSRSAARRLHRVGAARSDGAGRPAAWAVDLSRRAHRDTCRRGTAVPLAG